MTTTPGTTPATGPEQMCACEADLQNRWYDRRGEVVESRALNQDSDPRRDALEFNRHPEAVSWRIECPQCGRIYETGVSARLLQP